MLNFDFLEQYLSYFSGVWVSLSIWYDGANNAILDRILENKSQSAMHLLLFTSSYLKVGRATLVAPPESICISKRYTLFTLISTATLI